MFDNTLFKALSSQFEQFAKSNEHTHMQKQLFEAFIHEKLSSLPLVPKSEFEAQKKILLRTRARVEALEKIIEDLKSPTDKQTE